MNHDTQLALADRILTHIANRTTDEQDIEFRQPVSSYRDPSRAERELDVLFRRRPIILGHASTLANPGDHITHDDTGVPIVAVRGDDGRIRGFLNICRHRGTRVVDGCGHAKSFTCPYHGWAYGRDGALRGIPHEHGFKTVDRASSGLTEIPVVEHAGFVWACTTPGAKLDADAWLGDLAADLEGFGLPSSVAYAPRVHDRELNWKLAIDVFLESYHLRLTHKDTIYPMFFDNLGVVEAFPPHLRNVFPKRTIRDLPGIDRSEWRLRDHANILYFVFPNTLILIEPDHAGVLHAFPRGPNACRVLSYTLIPEPPAGEKAIKYWDANNRILYAATDEDFQMGESIQRGVHAGGDRELVFGRFEHALTHFHRSVNREIDSA